MKYDLKRQICFHFLICSLLGTPFGLWAQAESLDSLSWDSLLQKGHDYKYQGNFQEALANYNRCLSWDDLHLHLERKGNILVSIGDLYALQGKYDQALTYLFQCLEIRKEWGNQNAIADAHNMIARMYRKQSNYTKALDFLENNLKLSEGSIGNGEIAATFNNLSAVYEGMGNHQRALSYAIQSLTLQRENQSKPAMARTLVRVGALQLRLGQVDSAMRTYQESRQLAEELESDQVLASALFGIGNVYRHQQDYSKAATYIQQSLSIRERLGLKNGLSISMQHLGQVYLQDSLYSKAIIWCEKSLALAEEMNLVGNQISACRCLYQATRSLGQDSQTLAYLERLWDLEKSQTRTKAQMRLQQMEFDKKIIADSLAFVQEKMETEHAYHTERSRRNMSLMALILSILGIFFVRYRQQVISRARKREIQQERERKEQLAELNSRRSRFFANISHEFRTPLTVIGGMTQQMVEDSLIHSKEREGFWETFNTRTTLILRNTQGLLQLIKQMLDLSKLDKGRLDTHLELGEIVGYLRYLSESFASYAETKDILLTFSAEMPSLLMDVDPEKLGYIVSNLLSNALKFTPEDGKIDFVVKQISGDPENLLEISVFNSGPGIAEEHVAHIFERFYQVDNRANHGGTGIGLAFTKELVELLEGKISVESEVGKGATFTVSLPIRQTAVPNPASLIPEPTIQYDSAQPAVLTIGGATDEDKALILIVEDNADVALYLQTCLQDQYAILWAKNGQEGIEQALEHIPDLIISDVMMPVKDGYELTQRLKKDEKTSHIPIILLTAKAEKTDKIAGLERGADAYLYKPFDKKELLVRVEQLIALRQLLQQRYSGSASFNLEKAKPPESPQAVDSIALIEDAFLQKVNKVLEIYYADSEFEIPRLGQELAMSHSQLYRKIKALTGKSIAAYLRSYRLHKGRELLQSSDLTVSEVTYSVGFTDPSYFSRMYLEEFGIRPTQVRKP